MQRILQAARARSSAVGHFLRDIIAIPSPSGGESAVAQRILEEMQALGYDEARLDAYGNVLGRIGRGSPAVLFDSHIDTVGVGDRAAWPWDPFQGKEEDGWIYGRGASDNKGGLAAMVHAGGLIRDLGLHADCTVYVCGSVCEEDSDGIGYKGLFELEKIRPDYVVLGECTDLAIYRGHRGRMEIRATIRGRSCHASAPERGDNPITKMAQFLPRIPELNGRLKDDAFLGKGTIAATKIECQTPSLNAVPDSCTVYFDRRLTRGETKQTAVAELEQIFGAAAEVEILEYDQPSHTGARLAMEKYYPTWVLDEDHVLVQAGVDAFRGLFGKPPKVDKWTFSTNGVYTMGVAGVPTIGLGPAREEYAHSVQDRVEVEDLVQAMAFYAAVPGALQQRLRQEKS
ncbi:MAG TPA: YgeY family selenium metabolism-linked hydrolase [Acidobacteriota bacterium]